jgi:hypothetical protein
MELRSNHLRTFLLAVAGVLVATMCVAVYREYRNSVTYEAASSLRVINTACQAYAETYRDLGFPRELAQLGPRTEEAKGPQRSGLIDGVLASGVKSGYIYSYRAGEPDKNGKTTTYTFTAVPRQYGKSGRRSYYSDQTGTIHFTDENRAPTANDPVLADS